MGCGNEISEWDDNAVKDSMAGKNTGLDPTILKETMPAVREAIDQRCMELMQEKTDDARKNLQEKIAQSEREPDTIEKLDLEVEATKENFQEMFKVAKELGLKSWEIADTPAICGTKGVQNISNEIRDVMAVLHNSKIDPELWNRNAIDKIMFIDAKTAREKGIDRAISGFAHYEQVIQDLGLPRTLHIVLNEKNEWKMDKNISEKKAKLWLLAHEGCHLNCHLPKVIGASGAIDTGPIWGKIADNSEDWYKACDAQIKAGRVSEYSEIMLENNNVDFKSENLADDEEFLSENFAAWAIDSPDLCPDMKEFFDEHFSK